MKHKIFLDMDGVITDLDRRLIGTGKIAWDAFQKIRNRNVKDGIFWNVVNEAGLTFWSEMEWTTNGKELWKIVAPHSPTVLSACKKYGIFAQTGKQIWIRNNLGNVKYILCLREEKQKYAHEHSVLIDDRADNIAEWERNGGIGILYRNADFHKIKSTIIRYLV